MGIDTMGSYGMKGARLHTKGFTLIASLLLLLLLSGIAIGLMMMVTTESKVGATDLQNDVAYHSAEGGIEKMASDLAATFQNMQAPTAAQICAVSNTPPTMPGVTWESYSVAPASGCTGTLAATWGQISSGPNQNLWAQIIPVNMLATAALTGGQEVSMMRSAQVALIPVFQFGVFSESDLGFFDSPTLDFNGRLHTNADLYLGVMQGYTLTFHDKMEAYGNVVTEVLPNGITINYGGSGDTGNVYIPTTDGGCSTTTTNCVTKAANSDPASSPWGDGSVQGQGGNPPQSAYNTSKWNTFSKSTTNYEIINGNYGNTTNPGTGAKKLSMPFVGGNALPFEIIRRPRTGEDSTSALATSREYNMAQIHVLLSDDPNDLPGGSSDTNNVRLANVTGSNASNPYGIPMTAGNYPASLAASLPANNTYNLYFAAASNAVPNASNCSGTTCTPDWPHAPAAQTSGNPNPSLQPAGAPIYLNHGTPTISLCPPAGVASSGVPAGCPVPATGAYPYYAPPNAIGSTLYNSANATAWNLTDGWLRVEYRNASGSWVPVTNEWLQLGFARGLTAPTLPGSSAPAAGTNPVNPNAILLLQEPADRTESGTLPTSIATPPPACVSPCSTWTPGVPPEAASDQGSGGQWYFGVTPATPTTQSLTQYNWYPINFYDAREGEPRDTDHGTNSCTTNGVMNAVEIDVGNLKRWLKGSIGSSGPNVDYLAQNGYVLYFSDRRGMLYNPNPPYNGAKSGDSGLEDVINRSSQAGTPDGVLEPAPAGAPLSPTGVALSPEDVNENGVLDEWGTANLGLGQYNGATNQNVQITLANPDNPYSPRINSCSTTAPKNWVSGARHVLKLVDGSFGNVPLRTDSAATLADPGGFTVASENPVYIWGNYNSNAADPFWSGGADIAGHSSAAVIADAVTVLSNNWNDQESMGIPGGFDVTTSTTRSASTTYYRLAIAAGKNMSFPFPSWENGTDYPFGTDGGVHNFLRFLEDWNSSGATLHYGGSLVSLYYATYATGVFKCCTYSVYEPPTRDYKFDSDFTLPQGLPPGTPLFRDVESLGYRQLFTTRNATSQ